MLAKLLILPFAAVTFSFSPWAKELAATVRNEIAPLGSAAASMPSEIGCRESTTYNWQTFTMTCDTEQDCTVGEEGEDNDSSERVCGKATLYIPGFDRIYTYSWCSCTPAVGMPADSSLGCFLIVDQEIHFFEHSGEPYWDLPNPPHCSHYNTCTILDQCQEDPPMAWPVGVSTCKCK